MATARIDIRLDENIKRDAEKAAAFSNSKNLTEYIVKLIERESKEVIKRNEVTTLEDDVFDRFMKASENPPEPNQKLKDLVKFAESKGF